MRKESIFGAIEDDADEFNDAIDAYEKRLSALLEESETVLSGKKLKNLRYMIDKI